MVFRHWRRSVHNTFIEVKAYVGKFIKLESLVTGYRVHGRKERNRSSVKYRFHKKATVKLLKSGRIKEIISF